MIGKTRKTRILALGIALVLCLLTFCNVTVTSGLAAPVQQSSLTATLDASGKPIEFRADNDNDKPAQSLSHLILYKDDLTREISHAIRICGQCSPCRSGR